MKSTLKTCFATFVMCYGMHLNAQLSIYGNIDNWTNGTAMLAHSDMFTGSLENWGTIDDSGVLTIRLEYDYMDIFKKKAEEAQKEAPSGWTMSYKTIGDSFVCSGFENPLQYENDDTTITGVPELIIVSKDGTTEYGTLFTVSNPAIAKWLYSYGNDNPTTGYYIEWYYVEKEASVSGDCVRSTLTGVGDEEYDDTTAYDLKLEEGWNMVKYEITEVFNSESGKVYPLKTNVSVVKFLPEDLQWVILRND